MKPLIWSTPENFKERHYMDYNWRPMNERTNSYIFMGGRFLPCQDIGNLKYSQDPKDYDLTFASECLPKEFKRFDCLPNNGQAPLVNQKVLDILSRLCPDDFQAFPVVIVPEPGSPHSFENHDYWLINITKQVEAIDLEKSILSFFEEMPNRVSSIKKLLFLNDKQFETPLIARIINDRSFEIVSPPLAQALKESNVTGVQFIEDKDY